MPSVYVASRFEDKDQARSVRDALVAAGVACTSRWLEEESKTESSEQERRRYYAVMDLEDILSADALVLLDAPETHRTGTGGRHVETGYAIAAGKQVLIYGERENVFHSLPQVRAFSDLGELVEAAKGLPRARVTLVDEYQAFTRTTAKYPGVGERTISSALYPALGKAGELGEYLEKLVTIANAAAAELAPGLEDRTDMSYWTFVQVIGALRDVAKACRLAEDLKRPIRKGEYLLPALRALTADEVAGLAPEGGDGFWYDAREMDEIGVSLSDVLTENRNKLESRLLRNVIHGSGDNR